MIAGNPPQTHRPESIEGERRNERRYTFSFEMAYRFTRGSENENQRGRGTTIDFSSHGLSFVAGKALRPGIRLAVIIQWRSPLGHVAQLEGAGRVVRNPQPCVAVRITNWRFTERSTTADTLDGLHVLSAGAWAE